MAIMNSKIMLAAAMTVGWLWATCTPLAVLAQGTFVETDVTVIHRIQGPGGTFGWAVAELEDIDNPPDGVMDMIISGPGLNKVWVYSGRTGTLIHEISAPPGAQNFGNGVSDAGDTDGDGVHDIVVGAPGAGFGSYPGGVHIFSGADGSLLLSVPGEAGGDQLGFGVGGVGDVNADGFDDVVAGAPGFGANVGRGYVLSGADGAFLHVFDGEGSGDFFGIGAAGARDINGDGIGDLIIGAQGAGANGKAYVYSGADGSLLVETFGQAGASVYGQFFVAGVGDVNNDGTRDVYVGDYSANGGAGKAYVHSGVDGSQLHVFPGAGGDGVGPGRGAGDVDGDGYSDLVVGHYTHGSGAGNAGRVTIRSGRTGQTLRTITSTTAGEQLGFDAVGLGDVNADGFIDYLLAAASGNRVYVVAGYEFASCAISAGPQAVEGVVDANRYLALAPPVDGQPSAIRVTLTDLDGFSEANGEVRWVGQPADYPDVGAEVGNTFSASPLQCDAFFMDWSGVDRVYVYGVEVVPRSVYTVKTVTADCGADTLEENFSASIELATQKWGDIVPPFWTPAVLQPDFNDIASVVHSFVDGATAPNKPRAQLQPDVPVPSQGIDFRDIAATVAAFVGDPYPFAGPGSCPP